MKVIAAFLTLAFAVNAEVLEYPEPYNVSVEDVTFTLYTKKHGDDGTQMFLGDRESIKKAGFIPGLPVKVATHGYLADACSGVVLGLRRAFIAREDCNFISVDWSSQSKNILYEQAARAVRPVGILVSKFLRFLRDESKADAKAFHVIGHSLGAHVMSFASDEFPGEKIGRITGTDPAGPIFENLPDSERLDHSDAHFVDVIHTSTVYLGMRKPSGAVDFYVNGGKQQPGCAKYDFQCHHNMAYRYFIETIKTGKNYDALKCKDLQDAEKGTCSGEKAPMGLGASTAKPGIYHAKVDKAPAA